MIVKDYISKGGAHIIVDDSALDNSKENRQRVYKNLSEICTRIHVKNYMKNSNNVS